ncbi:MAG TPA: helicase-related protein [Gemmatimonadaceae bacterium]|nr:helicase-related protein [Gemmatimonadaceae bacterium]
MLDATASAPHTLGDVTLRPHQRASADRLLELIAHHGGALLADRVGTGKTYTALAVASRERAIIVIAPSSLRDMWRDALATTGVAARIVTHESLSRGDIPTLEPSIVLVDEAHRFRNPATRRYAAAATLCRRAKVLLVSATPIQNARNDLAAQLALFLGRRAWSMDEAELAAYVVRDSEPERLTLPVQLGPIRIELDVDDDCTDDLLALPPPVPARDESLAAALLTCGFVHQWTSSRAALVSALRRRRTKALALSDALSTGVMPSRAELAAWTHLGDAMQLAFPELVVAAGDDASSDVDALRDAIAAHLAALEHLLARLRSGHDPDDARADALRIIRDRHSGERVIAFCHYAETVAALWRRLSGSRGVAALTAAGARVAGGRISRRDVLTQFQPGTAARPIRDVDRIDLLLTTDVLSEGLNLQEASVVVHLDLPWNPARLEQRVGRVRRLGSRHATVSVYALAPPARADALLRIDERLRAKLSIARRTVGIAGQILPSMLGDGAGESGAAELHATILTHLRRWASPRIPAGAADPLSAAVVSSTRGFLALIANGSRSRLVAKIDGPISSDAKTVLRALALAEGPDMPIDANALADASRCLSRWLEHQRGAIAVDLSAAAAARSRRTALERVRRALSHAPRHRRAQLAPLADAARAVVAAPLGEGAERVLEMLVRADLPDEAWLRSIAAFGELNARPPAPSESGVDRVAAIILFQSPAL